MAKTPAYRQVGVPYFPCTPAAHYARAGRGGTVSWLKFMDTARMLRQVTQPPHIAGPLPVSWGILRTKRLFY